MQLVNQLHYLDSSQDQIESESTFVKKASCKIAALKLFKNLFEKGYYFVFMCMFFAMFIAFYNFQVLQAWHSETPTVGGVMVCGKSRRNTLVTIYARDVSIDPLPAHNFINRQARQKVLVLLRVKILPLILRQRKRVNYKNFHMVRRAVKVPPEKTQSHLTNQFPSEMTLLKSLQNLQSRLKSNFPFTPISNICFKKFSR